MSDIKTLDSWLVRRILDRWWELCEAIGGSASRVDEGYVDHTGYRESDRWLWLCTVSARVARCPELPIDPRLPSGRRMTVIEQVLHIEARLNEYRNRLEEATRVQRRSQASPSGKGRRTGRAETARSREVRDLARLVHWGEDRVQVLMRTDEYRASMIYLGVAFARAWRGDRTFVTSTALGLLDTDDRTRHHDCPRLVMALRGLTADDIAQAAGVTRRTVDRWIADPRSARYQPMPEWHEGRVLALLRPEPETEAPHTGALEECEREAA